MVSVGWLGCFIIFQHYKFYLLVIKLCCQYLLLQSVELTDNILMIIWKGFGRRGILLAFVWTDCMKPRKISVRMADLPTQIRTEHLLNTLGRPVQ